MKKYSTSTKVSPLLFFETFLKKGSLLEYKNQFFSNPINPSFVPNENEGFIEYTKDSYEDSEQVVPVKIYFKDRLRELMQIQYNTSKVLSGERVIEIKNTELNANIYINRQIQIIRILINELKFDIVERDLLINILDKLDNHFSNLLNSEKTRIPRTYIRFRIPGETFFDIKEAISPKQIKLLYKVTSELYIIDPDAVTEENFFNVLTQSKLPNNSDRIIFKKNNRISVFYINVIAQMFHNFTPRTIERSLSFFNSRGKNLNENDINKVNSFLKKNSSTKYSYIKDAIESRLL